MVAMAIAAAGLALSAYGAYQQQQGMSQAAAGQQQALEYQQQQDKLRQQQMNLDAARRKREMIRSAIGARAAALTTTTAQGAAQSSALPGAYGGISGRTGVNEQGVNQNQEIGNNMFASKASESAAWRSAAAGGSLAAFGSGLMNFGGALVKNEAQLTRLSDFAMGGVKSAASSIWAPTFSWGGEA